jgi:predicted PurR-regulated permease PerM
VWLAALGALTLAYLFRGLVVPLVLAAILAYLLNPIVTWAQGFGFRRTVGVTGLFLSLGLLLAAAVVGLGPRVKSEVVELAERLPALADEVDAALVLAGRELVETVPAARRILPSPEARRGWLDQVVEGRAARLDDALEHAGHLLLFSALVPFFAFFFLRDTGRLVRLVLNRVPPAHMETSVAVWCEINRIVGGYVRGVALDGVVIAILVSLGLWTVGVPYPLLLGAFAGLANIVPIVGPLLGATMAGLVALTSGQGLGRLAAIVALFVVVKLVDDTVIQPLTIGRSVHLHPVLLIASVVAGGQALGVLGMVIAVPIATVLQETIRLWLEHRRALASYLHNAEEAGPSYFVC